MPDSRWILELRQRRYNVVKKVIIALDGKSFTAQNLVPRVKKATWSYYRWDVTVQTIVGALKRLVREGFIEKIGAAHLPGRNKRYSSTIYRAVGETLEEE